MSLSRQVIWKRLKFTFAFGVVVLVCFGLIVYENNTIATIGANSASLNLATYAVGTTYDGLVVGQYVNQGDSVRVGQKLYEIKSDKLASQLAAGTLKAADLSSSLSSNGDIILTAQHSGIISQVDALAGSFVTGGKTLAVITGMNGATVRSNFELSNREYDKISVNTPVRVLLGAQSVQASITGITQESSNGHTITTITAALPSIDKTQTIYQTGAPVNTSIVLNNHTLYNRLHNVVESYIH